MGLRDFDTELDRQDLDRKDLEQTVRSTADDPKPPVFGQTFVEPRSQGESPFDIFTEPDPWEGRS